MKRPRTLKLLSALLILLSHIRLIPDWKFTNGHLYLHVTRLDGQFKLLVWG